MGLGEWEKRTEHTVADLGIFEVTRITATSPRTGHERPFTRILAGDWVNVVAITTSGEVVLVRQYRHGTEAFGLEVPGGLVDPGESPRDAAVRELREETGYTAGEVSDLGVIAPNPAVQDNLLHTFLVEGCDRTHDLAMDAGEDIEVVTRPLADVPGLVDDGTISHALVVIAFWWLARRRPELLRL